jgi:phage shock protein A
MDNANVKEKIGQLVDNHVNSFLAMQKLQQELETKDPKTKERFEEHEIEAEEAMLQKVDSVLCSTTKKTLNVQYSNELLKRATKSKDALAVLEKELVDLNEQYLQMMEELAQSQSKILHIRDEMIQYYVRHQTASDLYSTVEAQQTASQNCIPIAEFKKGTV